MYVLVSVTSKYGSNNFFTFHQSAIKMKKIYHLFFALLSVLVAAQAWSQSSPNCATASDDDYLYGRTFFNFGSTTRARNTKVRINTTIGQPTVGSFYGPSMQGTHGFWASFLLPPAAPIVMASEGDLEDRVQIDWTPDPLSPAAVSHNIYRNGSLLATVGERLNPSLTSTCWRASFTRMRCRVSTPLAKVSGAALGFLNPNGVVTGQVKSSTGNPVPGAVVTLAPTIGASARFSGDDMVFSEYNPVYPRSQFTLSCWVKIDDGNDNTAIFDFGSHIGKTGGCIPCQLPMARAFGSVWPTVRVASPNWSMPFRLPPPVVGTTWQYRTTDRLYCCM
jgi:hypothetical protein